MVQDLNINLLESLNVIKTNDKKIIRAYQQALENLDLSVTDYLTIRDIVEISEIDSKDEYFLHIILICMFMIHNQGSICLKLTPDNLNNKLSLFLETEEINSLSQE